MTNPSRDEIVVAAAEGKLLDLIFMDSWQHDSEPFSQALIDAHQSNDVDLRTLLPLPEQTSYERSDFNLGMTIFLPALGSIATSGNDLLELIAGAIPLDDPMYMHSTYTELVKWCRTSPEHPLELLGLIGSGVPIAQRFPCVQACISTGLSVDAAFYQAKAVEFLENGDAHQRAQAARALGNLSIEVWGTDFGLIETILAVINRETETSVRDALLTLALAWQKDAPPELQQSTYRLIERATTPITVTAKQAVALELMRNPNPYGAQVRRDLLALVASGNPEDEVVHLLDNLLAWLIRREQVSEAKEVIEKLILGDPGVPFSRFTSVRHQLESGDAVILDKWVVDWLRSESLDLSLTLRRSLFTASEGRVFKFDFSQAPDIPESDYSFIASRALGVFFSKQLFVASLIVSLLRNATHMTSSALRGLLFDPVLINYSGLQADYLDAIAADSSDPASEAVQQALGELRAYLEGLGDEHIRELQPSERERQLEHYRRNEEMQNQMVEARKYSFLANLASEKVLLYGTGMASWIPEFPLPQDIAEGEIGPMRRIEQSLATVRHTVKLPRHSVLEPSTLEIQILNFLYEKRTS